VFHFLRHYLLSVAVGTISLQGTLAAAQPLGEDYEPGQWRAAVERDYELTTIRLFDEAAELERGGRPDGALAAYRELLSCCRAGSLRTEALFRAARLHQRLGQHREAQPIYEQLLAESADPSHTIETLAALAAIAAAAGETDVAREHSRELLEKFPQSPQAAEAAYWLARVAADEQDTAQAHSYVRWLLVELDPQRFSATSQRQLWALTVCLQCQLAAAEQDWNQLQDIAAESLAHLPEGVERNRIEFWWAEAEFRTQQFDAARNRFEQLDPRMVGLTEPWVALVPLRRAQLAARRGQWNEVLKLVERIDRDHPDFPFPSEVDYLRGRALAGRGDWEAARAAYQSVLNDGAESDPETIVMAQWMIGETYFHQRDLAQARAAYQAVIDRPAPVDWQARAALQVGKCWELEDRWDQAQAMYQQALTDWPAAEPQPQIEARLNWAQTQSKPRR